MISINVSNCNNSMVTQIKWWLVLQYMALNERGGRGSDFFKKGFQKLFKLE